MDTKHLVALISGYLLLNLYLKIYDASDVLPSSCIALASYKAENLAEKNVVFKKSKHRSIPRQFPRPHSQLLHHRLAQCNWKQSITTHPLAIQYAGPNCHDDQNVSLPLQ